MVNGIDLEPVQLKQPSLDGDITDKMKSLHGSHSTDTILLFRQVPWLRPARAREARGQRRVCLLQRKGAAREPLTHLAWLLWALASSGALPMA